MPTHFLEPVQAIEPELLSWRRWLHQHAEVSFQEVNTTRFIEERLRSFGNIEIRRLTATGVVGVLRGARPGKTIAFRADIDALPMQEENDLPFASQTPGVMHACGHDGHTAMLLAAAKVLSQMQKELTGEIRFLFQHAEELPPGGAEELVKAGAVDGVEAVFGLHLSSNYPTGVFGVRSGALTSATDRFDIVVKGRGGHSAFPEQCVDPVVTGAQIITALQTVVARRTSALDAAVLSVCRVQSGAVYNIIPNTMEITGSVRTFQESTRGAVPRQMEQIVKGITQTAGADYSFDYSLGYGSVVNDPALSAQAERLILDSYGEKHLMAISPLMPGEDFSAYLEGRPGFFVELGSADAEKRTHYPHHNTHYKLDEDALLLGADYFVRMARRMLAD